MRKHCGNCANYRKETNQFSEECGKCVSARLKNGETTDPSHWKALPQTNADRIRAMSDEELAAFVFSMVDCVSCQNKLMNNGKLVFGADRKTCTDKDYYAMCDGDGRKCESVCLEWLKQPAE